MSPNSSFDCVAVTKPIPSSLIHRDRQTLLVKIIERCEEWKLNDNQPLWLKLLVLYMIEVTIVMLVSAGTGGSLGNVGRWDDGDSEDVSGGDASDSGEDGCWRE